VVFGEVANLIRMPLPTKLLIKSTVRTLKTRIIPNKKASEEANLLNGASNGLKFELHYLYFSHLCLHDKDTIKKVKLLLNTFNYKEFVTET